MTPPQPELLSREDFVENCTPEQLKTMLTWCVRGECFCDGHWEGVLRYGQVVILLRRLEVVRQKLD